MVKFLNTLMYASWQHTLIKVIIMQKIEIRCYFYKNYTEHNEEDIDEENSIKELKIDRINKKRICSES